MDARELGDIGRDQGIARSTRHANRVTPGWGDIAYAFLVDWIAHGRAFIAPEVRKAFERAGHQPAPTAQAWGGVLLRARNAGLIRYVGAITYGDETMHTQTVRQWVQANRTMGGV